MPKFFSERKLKKIKVSILWKTCSSKEEIGSMNTSLCIKTRFLKTSNLSMINSILKHLSVQKKKQQRKLLKKKRQQPRKERKEQRRLERRRKVRKERKMTVKKSFKSSRLVQLKLLQSLMISMMSSMINGFIEMKATIKSKSMMKQKQEKMSCHPLKRNTSKMLMT